MTERSRSRALVAAAALFAALGLVVVTWNIPLPLIAYSPGPITDAVDSVAVEGVPLYESDGELIMLTAAWQDINAFEVVIAAADPAVDVLAKNVVRRPDETDEEYRRRNLQQMDQSTSYAITAALDRVEVGEDADVFIVGLVTDTPAGQVLEIGDRVVAVQGEPVDSLDNLAEILSGYEPGDSVSVEVVRQGEELAYEVELVASEDEPERPLIGITVRELPFWVEIESGVVGGPSAGLMYTLAIIDSLTPGSLTRGNVVAGTGTIDPEGNVGSIGAVRQKVVAAQAAGAEFMLLPEGNHEQARTAPSGDLELVPVSTVDEALQFLDGLGVP